MTNFRFQAEDITLLPDEKLDEVNENLKIIQKTKGLTYGTDAYLISAFVRGSKNSRAADLGSGTGIISLLCAKREKAARIYSLEIQESFAELIKRNAILNHLDDKILPLCIDIRDIKPEDVGGELDFVVSNPPYLKIDSGKRNNAEEKYIARHEVCGNIDNFCSAASRLLKYGGSFYCVYRTDRLTDLIVSMRQNKLEPKRAVFVCATKDTPPSMVLVESRKGSSSGMKTEMLILSETSTEGKTVSTERTRNIYENCNFE